jgi:hypothetical protein
MAKGLVLFNETVLSSVIARTFLEMSIRRMTMASGMTLSHADAPDPVKLGFVSLVGLPHETLSHVFACKIGRC